jgi:hypothetical protein
VEVAVQHAGGLEEDFAERDRREHPLREPVMPTIGRSSAALEYPIDFANDRRRYSAKSGSP